MLPVIREHYGQTRTTHTYAKSCVYYWIVTTIPTVDYKLILSRHLDF